jgi:hypothetical protein
MDLRMAWTAQRYEISRILIEDPDISQVVNFSRTPFPALFADVVCALENPHAALVPRG